MTEPGKDLQAATPAPAGAACGRAHCPNCGTLLAGPYCHQCGQSTRHVLRHLPALVSDAADIFFNFDGRLAHTLPALFFRPGFLTREYFAGRRVRYIAPFRLMFFLSVLAFLLIRLTVSLDQGPAGAGAFGFDQADTPAEVRKSLDDTLADIRAARRPDLPEVGRLALDTAAERARRAARRRLWQLGALDAAPATSVPLIRDSALAHDYLRDVATAPDRARLEAHVETIDRAILDSREQIGDASPQAAQALENLRDEIYRSMGDRQAALPPAGAGTSAPSAADAGDAQHRDWLERRTVVHVGWLPQFANDRITADIAHFKHNLNVMRAGDPVAQRQAVQRFSAAFMSVLPQVLLVMLPVFALLLKLVYLFKRRLYIEHLMVAFHSHAFIFLALLLSMLLALAGYSLPPWADTPLDWLQGLLWTWVAVYLLLMQKRIYRQGWPMTVLKFGFVGFCYSILLGLAMGAAMVIGLSA